MKFKNYLLSLLVLSSTGISAQSFTKYTPDGAFGFGNNIVSNLVVRNNDIVGFTSGDNTLFYFNNGSFTIKAKSLGFYNYSNGSAGRELDIDSDGDMWLVHSSSVDQYDNTTITNWNSTSTDLPADNVEDMAINNDGKMFFGINSNGVSIYDNGSWSHYPNHTGGLTDLNTKPFPKFLEADKVNNNIFLGEFSNVHLIHDNNTMTSFDNTNFFGTFNSANISCMTATQDGKIWFGIESFGNDPATSGIFMYDGSTWTHYNTNNSSIPVNGITAMTSIQNKIYFAGQNVMGIHEFDGNNVMTYDSLNSTFNQSNIFNAFVNDMVAHNGKIYMAQQDGLVEFDFPGGNGPSGLEEAEINNISVYPNPTKGIVKIQSEETIESVDVYNISGHLVQNSNQKELDISVLEAGVYFIKVIDVKGNQSTQRVTKQ